jgi:hypothetical protein
MSMNAKKYFINVCIKSFTVAVLKLKEFPAPLHSCYYFESNTLLTITLPYKQKPKQKSTVQEQHSQNWISR